MVGLVVHECVMRGAGRKPGAMLDRSGERMKATRNRFVPAWRRKLLTLAVASCFAGELAYANPTGPSVAQGQAAIATQGNVLTVTNSPGTVINWQGFSIASQEITRFLQQSAASAVLNRVVGVNPSTILGALQSNGRVFLINPNGITIGQGATIDVAGFLASTLNLSDADFLAGRYRFSDTAGTGTVVNQGTITTPAGGMVYLVGQNVENQGVIKSPNGEILLAAGKSIELVDAGTPEIRVQITAPDNQALNLGQLLASGGRIGMVRRTRSPERYRKCKYCGRGRKRQDRVQGGQGRHVRRGQRYYCQRRGEWRQRRLDYRRGSEHHQCGRHPGQCGRQCECGQYFDGRAECTCVGGYQPHRGTRRVCQFIRWQPLLLFLWRRFREAGTGH